MIILGKTLPDLDVADLETAKKIDAFYAKYQDAGNAVADESRRVVIIETICNAVFEGFDDLFGDGAAKLVFGDKTNMRDCIKAAGQVTAEIQIAQNALTDEINETKKNMGNRAARRSAAKNKK